MEDDLKNFKIEDDLKNFKMEDDLKNFKMEDDLKNFNPTIRFIQKKNSKKFNQIFKI